MEFPGEQSTTVLNLNPDVDWKKQPMFFGEKLGVARFDQIKYPSFVSLTKAQKENFWSEEDVNLSQDSIDYASKLQANQRHIFDKNIAYQTVMDTVTSRAILEAFLPWVSLPELEECIKTWAFFESIHNRAYQWIQQNLNVDPSVNFDKILKDAKVLDRAKDIVGYYDEFITYSNRVKVLGYGDYVVNGEVICSQNLYEHKHLAYRAMVSIYALESIRFYVSFACTFALGTQGLMVGNAKEMKLIARDEALHVGISLNILRYWPKEDMDFKKIADELREWTKDLFRQVVQAEIDWATYLFSEGEMLGLNAHSMKLYLEHLGNKRLKALGLEQVFDNKTNPYTFMKDWIASDEEQIAPQETEILDYKVSAMSNVVKEDDLLDF